MAFRRQFREAITLLARAVTIATEDGAARPVLVGGAAVEFVSGPLMDGKADLTRLYVFRVGNDQLDVVPVEDLIADRLGQALSGPTPRKDMLDQARKLYRLAENIDRDYLKKRIAEETAGAADLKVLDS